MIIRMAWDVVNWLLVVFFISLGVGVAYTILMPGQTFEYDRPFFRPFWGLLGDFDTDSINDYFPLDPTFMVSHELTMLLTWSYTFFTTILLVNLLIAQMGSTYETMKDESTALWLRQRVDLILEFKDDCDPLPPPLNVVHLLFNLVVQASNFIKWLHAKLTRRDTSVYNNTVNEKRGFRMAMGPRVSAATNELARRLCNGYIASADVAADLEKAGQQDARTWRASVERKVELMQSKMSRGLEEVNEKLDQMRAAMKASGGASPR